MVLFPGGPIPIYVIKIMSGIKVLLLCSSPFAIPVLQQLVYFNQLAMVGIPSSSIEMRENVNTLLSGSGVPVVILEKNNYVKQLTAAKNEYHYNLGLSVTFSFKIPAALYELPEKGFYNVHPGPLPEYRGPDPIFYQVKNKEKQAWVALHKLDEGWDSGPVFLQKNISLDAGDSYGQISARLALKATTLTEVLIKLTSLDLSIPLKPQDESLAKYYPRQQAKDVIINWEKMDAAAIIALVNAGNPWNKGAITQINHQIVRIVHACLLPELCYEDNKPGCIVSFHEKGMLISTITKQVICVTILYTDEGFYYAGNMKLTGLYEGQYFDPIA